MAEPASASPAGAAGVLLRALFLLAATLAGVGALLDLLRTSVSDILGEVEASAGSTPLEPMLVGLAAAALASCGLWLTVVAVAAAVEAVTGASSTVLRAISPDVVRRTVLLCCGAAVAGAGVVQPATAAEDGRREAGSPTVRQATAALAGLPLPDRALGRGPVSSVRQPGARTAQKARTTARSAATAPSGETSRALGTAVAAGTRPVAASSLGAGSRTYTVRPGDTLWAITRGLLAGEQDGPGHAAPQDATQPAIPPAADQHIAARQVDAQPVDAQQVDAAWRRVYRANRHAIGPDPGLITPGTTLRIPPLTAAGPRDRPPPPHHGKDRS